MTRARSTAKAPRSAVVTGAARGIGRAVAADLVRRGYLVLVTDIDGAAAARTADEIGAVEGLVLDVTDERANHSMATRARTHAPLGVWVCNAGVGFEGTAADMDSASIRALVDVNLFGVIWGARAATDAYRAQASEGVIGGQIGITASLSSHGPVPGLAIYAATKAAVLSLATSMHSELRREKIGIHAICPDGVDTQMVADMDQDSQARALIAAGTFFGPDEVARKFVDLFGSRRVYRTLPAWRGTMSRISAVAPGATMRLEPLIRKAGRRKLRS